MFKKITIFLLAISLTGCSSLVEINKRHSTEKKEMRTTHKQEVAGVVKENNKELKKLKTKQSVEFGIYVSHKLKLLGEFFK